jgi:hypothetical protein
VSWSLSLPAGTYYIVTTPMSDKDGGQAGVIDQCQAGLIDNRGEVSYRILLDTKKKLFWDTADVKITDIVARPLRTTNVEFGCGVLGTPAVLCWGKAIKVAEFTIVRPTNSLPVLAAATTRDSGYRNSSNAYMVFQSFYVDVDEANTYVRALLRDDDETLQVNPEGTVETQHQTKMFLQPEAEFLGTAVGVPMGTCLRSDSTAGDQRVAEGSLGVEAGATGYAPGFHYEKKVSAAGRYVLHVFRTCSTKVGECDGTTAGRDDSAKSFQYKIQVTTVKRATLQWTALRTEATTVVAGVPAGVDNTGAAVQKRGHGGAMVAVGDRYVVGVGGPLVANTSVPMTIFDTKDNKEYTMGPNADLDALDFPAVTASNNPTALSFYVTGGVKATEPIDAEKIKQAYNVFLVTITHNVGSAPTVAVSKEYAYAVGTVPTNLAARWGAAAVAFGDKILIQVGGCTT